MLRLTTNGYGKTNPGYSLLRFDSQEKNNLSKDPSFLWCCHITLCLDLRESNFLGVEDKLEVSEKSIMSKTDQKKYFGLN